MCKSEKLDVVRLTQKTNWPVSETVKLSNSFETSGICSKISSDFTRNKTRLDLRATAITNLGENFIILSKVEQEL
jgi:hypothetical protein